jgi:hypothetical protein
MRHVKVIDGSECVAWLLKQPKGLDGICGGNAEACVQKMQNLIDYNLLHHIKDKPRFLNRHEFYRLYEHDPGSSIVNLSTTAIIAGHVKQEVKSKGIFSISSSRVQRYALLCANQKTLFIFDTDVDSTPCESIVVNQSCQLIDIDRDSFRLQTRKPKHSITIILGNIREKDQWALELKALKAQSGLSPSTLLYIFGISFFPLLLSFVCFAAGPEVAGRSSPTRGSGSGAGAGALQVTLRALKSKSAVIGVV